MTMRWDSPLGFPPYDAEGDLACVKKSFHFAPKFPARAAVTLPVGKAAGPRKKNEKIFTRTLNLAKPLP